MFIFEKGKDEYLTGEIEIPKKEDPKFRQRKNNHHMIMSW